MENKGIFVGATGQKLNETLKEKLNRAVGMAVEEYGIVDFYFTSEQDYQDESLLISEAMTEKRNIDAYLAQKISEYRKSRTDKNIRTAMLAARPADKNFDEKLYDEILQGYFIYGEELDEENSFDSYALRDAFIAENVDVVLWYSNRILENTSPIVRRAKEKGKTVVYL